MSWIIRKLVSMIGGSVDEGNAPYLTSLGERLPLGRSEADIPPSSVGGTWGAVNGRYIVTSGRTGRRTPCRVD